LAPLAEAELFTEEEVLSGECGLGPKETAKEPKNIHSNVTNGEGRVGKAFT
jgi:hypothetical protein